MYFHKEKMHIKHFMTKSHVMYDCKTLRYFFKQLFLASYQLNLPIHTYSTYINIYKHALSIHPSIFVISPILFFKFAELKHLIHHHITIIIVFTQ